MNNLQDVAKVIGTISGGFAAIITSVAVIFLLIGAWKFISAKGDPVKVKSAKDTLIYASIGIIVAAIAATLPALVTSIFKGTTGL